MHDPQSPPIPVGTTFQPPSAWRGADLQASREWVHQLDAAEQDELRRARDAVRSYSGDLASLPRDVFHFQVLVPALRRWRGELQAGRGFVLVRGVPIEGVTAPEAARLYWLLGRELGDPVPQNGAGEMLCDVRDTGASPAYPNTRLYTTRAEQDFHTDGAAYEDHLEPDRRRHLLRLWLAVRDFEDGHELLRRGIDPNSPP